MKKTLIAAMLALSIAPPLTAGEIAIWYSCKEDQSPERILQELIRSGLVSRRPYAAYDSIEYFQAAAGTAAFGFKLVAVEGAELGSTFFHRAPGTGASSRIALIVQAQQGQVWRALNERKIPAHASRVVSESGPKVFIEPFDDFLPESEDNRLVYTRIACYPEW
jgi:hypothetical protein